MKGNLVLTRKWLTSCPTTPPPPKAAQDPYCMTRWGLRDSFEKKRGLSLF